MSCPAVRMSRSNGSELNTNGCRGQRSLTCLSLFAGGSLATIFPCRPVKSSAHQPPLRTGRPAAHLSNVLHIWVMACSRRPPFRPRKIQAVGARLILTIQNQEHLCGACRSAQCVTHHSLADRQFQGSLKCILAHHPDQTLPAAPHMLDGSHRSSNAPVCKRRL